ncbi:hypothetical protein DFH11DRAFT_1632242 [Phellopilus nigrolimitatus]|nr:hypothetical protein DFH11DRAFT_1632242 [Phellopilus nigrolimitatus]
MHIIILKTVAAASSLSIYLPLTDAAARGGRPRRPLSLLHPSITLPRRTYACAAACFIHSAGTILRDSAALPRAHTSSASRL